jgi:hypothetical protein
MHVHTLPELVSLAGGSVSLTLCPIADRRPSQFSTVFELYGPLGNPDQSGRAPAIQNTICHLIQDGLSSSKRSGSPLSFSVWLHSSFCFPLCEDQTDWDTYTLSSGLVGIHLRWDEYCDGEYPWGLCMSLTTMLRSGRQSNVA